MNGSPGRKVQPERSGPIVSPLLGREAERSLIAEALGRARSGESCALAFVGPPGIGKSALLEEAARLADGATLLRARGVEQEAEMPFSGLHEFLGRASAQLRGPPSKDAATLSGAFGVGRPPAPTGSLSASPPSTSLPRWPRLSPSLRWSTTPNGSMPPRWRRCSFRRGDSRAKESSSSSRGGSIWPVRPAPASPSTSSTVWTWRRRRS
jgi:hypothetical protein